MYNARCKIYVACVIYCAEWMRCTTFLLMKKFLRKLKRYINLIRWEHAHTHSYYLTSYLYRGVHMLSAGINGKWTKPSFPAYRDRYTCVLCTWMLKNLFYNTRVQWAEGEGNFGLLVSFFPDLSGNRNSIMSFICEKVSTELGISIYARNPGRIM